MIIKISKLTNSQDGKFYETNSSKSSMFAHSGVEYWDVSSMLNNIGKANFDLWKLMFVGLPLMHMALELIVKALVTFYDSSYQPKNDRHFTSKILIQYDEVVPIFKSITKDSKKMDLVSNLECAWEGLRYVECSMRCDGDEINRFNIIMNDLTDEYKKISGLRHL